MNSNAERVALDAAMKKTDEMLSIKRVIVEKGLCWKAQRIHESISSGEVRYEQVRGKRLTAINRAIVSVPVSQRYRLVYRDNGGKLDLIECCTHERYNKLIGRL
jgi:hypothetical protein